MIEPKTPGLPCFTALIKAASRAMRYLALALAVLALAIVSSRRPAATPTPQQRRTPSARERECYALGFVDALKKRDYGSSIGANDAEHDDLVEATLEDLPPEAQGIRDQWAERSGIGRKEDVRAAADL